MTPDTRATIAEVLTFLFLMGVVIVGGYIFTCALVFFVGITSGRIDPDMTVGDFYDRVTLTARP